MIKREVSWGKQAFCSSEPYQSQQRNGDPTHRLFAQITQVSVRLLTQIERVDGHYNNESMFAFDSDGHFSNWSADWSAEPVHLDQVIRAETLEELPSSRGL